MFSHKELIKTEYMNARELLKAELVKKLQEHTKEELIEMLADISVVYLLARIFAGANKQQVNYYIYQKVNTNTQEIKETLNEQEEKEDFRRYCVLKDAGLFSKTNKEGN